MIAWLKDGGGWAFTPLLAYCSQHPAGERSLPLFLKWGLTVVSATASPWLFLVAVGRELGPSPAAPAGWLDSASVLWSQGSVVVRSYLMIPGWDENISLKAGLHQGARQREKTPHTWAEGLNMGPASGRGVSHALWGWPDHDGARGPWVGKTGAWGCSSNWAPADLQTYFPACTPSTKQAFWMLMSCQVWLAVEAYLVNENISTSPCHHHLSSLHNQRWLSFARFQALHSVLQVSWCI